MDNKDIIIYVFGAFILILIIVLGFILIKNKNKNKNRDSVSLEEEYRYYKNSEDNNKMKNKFNEYKSTSENMTDLIINSKDENKSVTSQQEITPEFIKPSSVSRNIDALDFGMRRDINMDEYKEFLNQQDDDQYTAIFQPEPVFNRVAQIDPSIPSEEEVRTAFKQCMSGGTNTVEGCLTYSTSSLYPGLTKSLCQEYYNPLSPICQQIEARQMRQQNTSARSGPN
jgi:hypothetical protein